MRKIILIDNYDSFTFNLEQLLGLHYKGSIKVIRNDEIDLEYLKENNFSGIVISPGPGKPSDIPLSKSVIEHFYKNKPILGVCLGMQYINEVFGGKTIKAPYPVHGKTSKIIHNEKDIFFQIPQKITVARYHSLIVDDVRSPLEITAMSLDKIIMGIKHTEYPVFGVQFHPESFLTEYGTQMIKNFLNYL